MKRKGVECLLLASDVYPVWRTKVRAAEAEIAVFAPFMDRLLISLLSNNSDLPSSSIGVVTSFNPDSLLEMPNHLKTIKRLLKKGIQVFRLDGLHAKVLLVDNTTAVIGSQNFTSYARRNREVSVSPLLPLNGTSVLKTLQDWRRQAQPVDEDYIDILLTRLRRHIKRHRENLKDVEETLRQADEEYEMQRQNNLLRKLRELEEKSLIRLARGPVYATIQFMGTKWNNFNFFATLLADPEYDMTRWCITHRDGTTKPYHLSRLSMYPMLVPETMRMGFARIGKTRITYIRNSLDWDDKKLRIGDLSLNVSITFPKTETKRRNITVRLSDDYSGSCDCEFLFTGDSVRLVRHTFHSGSSQRPDLYAHFTRLLEKEFLGRSEAVNEFFRLFFDHFKYAFLGNNKNIREFLNGTRFRLSVIQYMDNPFLVVKKEG